MPEQIQADPEIARRARLIVGISLALGVLVALGLPLRMAVADSTGWLAIQIFNLAVFFSVPFFIRATGRLSLAASLTLIAALSGMVIFSYYEGGLHSPVVVAAPFIPLMATLMIGRRAGWLLTTLIIGLSLVAIALNQMGKLHPRSLLTQDQEILMRGLGIVMTTLMVAYLVWIWEHERKKAEEQLRLARRTAERASKAKNEFLATMSHDIQAPMAGIVGLSDLLLELDLPPEAWGHARTISASTEKLGQILDEIAKIDSGELVLEITEFSLQESLDEVVDLLRPAAAAKGIEIGSQIREAVSDRRRGDAARLRQILLNLVGNAIKFTDEGRVDIVAQPGLDDDGVHFVIHDTGLAKGSGEHLIPAFQSREDSSARLTANSGLGLAISRQLAELMGGSLQVEDSLQQGSTFSFTASLAAAPGDRD